MRVGLGQELYLPGFAQLLETLQYFGGIFLKLFQRTTTDGESYFEILSMGFDQLHDQGIHGEVIFLRYPVEDMLILKVVVIIMIVPHLKKAVCLEPERLVYLKIKAN